MSMWLWDGSSRRVGRRSALGGVLLGLLLAAPAAAVTLADDAAEYLLIGTSSQGIVGTVTAVSNFELGANTVAVPMSGLAGSVPTLPGNAATVFVGIGGNGDTALTNPGGTFNFSNLDIYGDMGVDCAGTAVFCSDNEGFVSNTTFTGTGGALSLTNGINGPVNLTGVTNEITNLGSDIAGLSADITLDFSSDGIWDSDLVINLVSGVTVIDFLTGGNDLSLTNENLLIDGPDGAFAIFRVPDDANFLATQSNIVVGDGGIGLNNVIFASFKDDNDQHFNFNGNILNGVAFWDFSDEGQISLNNGQGCTQLVAGKINVNDVRLNNCAFVIPEPATGSLLMLGLAGLAAGPPLVRRLRTR